MDNISNGDISSHRESKHIRTARWLVRIKAVGGFRCIHFWIILVLLAVLTYIYYAVLTGFHDIYLIIFFYPLIYTALVYRLRGVVIGGLAVLGILLLHTLLFNYDSYALARVLLFAGFTFLISSLVATLLNYLEKQLDAYYEIVILNDELNRYIERLENTQKQLIQAEKLNAIGQLAASVAHEINNPLGGVLVYNRLLIKKLTDDSLDKQEAVENLKKIEKAIAHCSHIIKSLLDFSRQSEPELAPVSLESITEEVMALVAHQAEMNRVRVSIGNMSTLPEIVADARQLQQVFVNLIVNAIQAMPDGGELSIQGSIDEDSWLKVSVEDTGCGILPEDMDKLFTPFYTTKEREKGTGLGLAVSYGIIERHGGRIEVQSKFGEGSTFTVRLPRRERSPNQKGISL
ncbi:sensor histidine kinase [Chloroflexota bacterium]